MNFGGYFAEQEEIPGDFLDEWNEDFYGENANFEQRLSEAAPTAKEPDFIVKSE